jgi:3-oxoacyl-[acyl-carrier protein] reductase
MELRLKGKRALITGASYGLGYACADALAAEGVDVAITARNPERLEHAAQQIADRHNVKAIGIPSDLTNPQELEKLVQDTRQKLGSIDILVVSTGHPPTLPFTEAEEKDWTSGMDLVLRPPIVLSRLVLDGMRNRKYGRIIIIGSIFGIEPEKSSVVQSTLRTGVNALAKCIASEVAAYGVTVNVICPGYFDTPLVQDLAKQIAEGQKIPVEQVLNEWEEYSPVKKFGKPDDLGALVAFIASPRAEFITGTAITMDGGAVRQY